MHWYTFIAPGFTVIHILVNKNFEDCLLSVDGRERPLSRRKTAELLRNARQKHYLITRVQ